MKYQTLKLFVAAALLTLSVASGQAGSAGTDNAAQTKVTREDLQITVSNAEHLVSQPYFKEDDPLSAMLSDAVFAMLYQADKQGLSFELSPKTREVYKHWKQKRRAAELLETADWQEGPQKVQVDPVLAPWPIPKGYSFLSTLEVNRLHEEMTKIGMNFVKDVSLLQAPHQAWVARIAVLKSGFFQESELQVSPDRALTKLQLRLNPIGNLEYDAQSLAAYDEDLVRWVVPPKYNAAQHSLIWANTNGQRRYLGQPAIQSSRLIFGRTHLISIKLLTEPEEQAVLQMHNAFAALQTGLQFLVGQRYEDHQNGDPIAQGKVYEAIAGSPTALETGVQRMLDQDARKRNIFLFLWDHPKYIAMLLSALVAFQALRGQRRNGGSSEAGANRP